MKRRRHFVERQRMLEEAGRVDAMETSAAPPAAFHRRLHANNENDGGNTTTTTSSSTLLDAERKQQARMMDPDLLPKDHERTTTKVSLAAADKSTAVVASTSQIHHLARYYPVTTLLLGVIHVLYMYQWSRHRRRRRRRRAEYQPSKLTYQRIVQRKQFYNWWLVFLSQYHPVAKQQRSYYDERTGGGGGGGGGASIEIGTAGGDDDDAANDEMYNQQQGSGASSSSTTDGSIIGSILTAMQSQISTTIIRYIPESWLQSSIAERIRHWASFTKYILQDYVEKAGGHESLLSLLYNTHLLWSCRALEVHYGRLLSSNNNSDDEKDDKVVDYDGYRYLQYVRVIMSVSIAATLLELAITRHLLRLLTPKMEPPPPTALLPPSNNNGDDPLTITSRPLLAPAENDSTTTTPFNSPAVRRFRKMLRNRTMGTPSLSMLTAALLLIFRFNFPYVPISVLPFIPISRWLLRSAPGVSYIFAMILLYMVSSDNNRQQQKPTWAALASGTVIGLAWGNGLLDFCASAYYGNAVIFMAILLTALSIKAKHSPTTTAPMVCCINHVAWNARGKMLLYDENLNQWVEEETEDTAVMIGTTSTINDTDGEDSEDNSSSTEDMDDDDESERAFPTIDDEAIYGRLPSMNWEMGEIDGRNNDDNGDDDSTTELLPLTTTNASSRLSPSNQVLRSRRS